MGSEGLCTAWDKQPAQHLVVSLAPLGTKCVSCGSGTAKGPMPGAPHAVFPSCAGGVASRDSASPAGPPPFPVLQKDTGSCQNNRKWAGSCSNPPSHLPSQKEPRAAPGPGLRGKRCCPQHCLPPHTRPRSEALGEIPISGSW